MVNPKQKPIRNLSSKLNRPSFKRRKFRRNIPRPRQDPHKSVNQFGDSIIDLPKPESREENENFKTFAPDDETPQEMSPERPLEFSLDNLLSNSNK